MMFAWVRERVIMLRSRLRPRTGNTNGKADRAIPRTPALRTQRQLTHLTQLRQRPRTVSRLPRATEERPANAPGDHGDRPSHDSRVACIAARRAQEESVSRAQARRVAHLLSVSGARRNVGNESGEARLDAATREETSEAPLDRRGDQVHRVARSED